MPDWAKRILRWFLCIAYCTEKSHTLCIMRLLSKRLGLRETSGSFFWKKIYCEFYFDGITLNPTKRGRAQIVFISDVSTHMGTWAYCWGPSQWAKEYLGVKIVRAQGLCRCCVHWGHIHISICKSISEQDFQPICKHFRLSANLQALYAYVYANHVLTEQRHWHACKHTCVRTFMLMLMSWLR